MAERDLTEQEINIANAVLLMLRDECKYPAHALTILEMTTAMVMVSSDLDVDKAMITFEENVRRTIVLVREKGIKI